MSRYSYFITCHFQIISPQKTGLLPVVFLAEAKSWELVHAYSRIFTGKVTVESGIQWRKKLSKMRDKFGRDICYMSCESLCEQINRNSRQLLKVPWFNREILNYALVFEPLYVQWLLKFHALLHNHLRLSSDSNWHKRMMTAFPTGFTQR